MIPWYEVVVQQLQLHSEFEDETGIIFGHLVKVNSKWYIFCMEKQEIQLLLGPYDSEEIAVRAVKLTDTYPIVGEGLKKWEMILGRRKR